MGQNTIRPVTVSKPDPGPSMIFEKIYIIIIFLIFEKKKKFAAN